MGIEGGPGKEQLFSELERWHDRYAEFSAAFLTVAQRCRNREPGNETLNNLKVATILQEIALQKYQRTVDQFSDHLRLDQPTGKTAKFDPRSAD